MNLQKLEASTEVVLMVAGFLWLTFMWIYIAALLLNPNTVSGPHSYEWAGRTCPSPNDCPHQSE